VSRGQISNAVVDLICERGLAGWSIRDLAGRLGVSTGTITHYYRDKRALLIAAMDAVYVLPADWDRSRSLSPVVRLRQLTEMFVLDDERRRRWGHFWLAYLAGAGHDAVLRQHQEERYERQRRFFARLIAGAAVQGAPRAPLDADHEAARLVALGYGLAAQQVAAPAVVPPAEARTILDAHLTDVLGPVDMHSIRA
jgi:AcrR family transcriptional regulator